MEITIKATPEEITALVVAIQERRTVREPQTESLEEIVRGVEIVENTKANNMFIHSSRVV